MLGENSEIVVELFVDLGAHTMSIKCHFDHITPDSIAGWAWDPDAPQVPVVVDLFDGSTKLATMEASQHRADLARARFRDGNCAFWYRCPPGQRIEDAANVRGIFHLATQPLHKVELGGQRSDDGWVDFGTHPEAALKKVGLSFSKLRGRQRFAAETRFETPIAVDATFAPNETYEIGAFTGIYGGTLNRCTIGRYCSIAADAVIGPNEHTIDWLSTSLVAERPHIHGWHELVAPGRTIEAIRKGQMFEGNLRRTVIGNDVWLGNGVFVRAGVTIGDGAVIGARSVVVKDIPPYAVAVGNPARVKRMRFPEPTVERLRKVQWWRYSLYDLTDIPFNRIEAAIDAIELRIGNGKIAEYRPVPYTLQRLREALGAPTP